MSKIRHVGIIVDNLKKSLDFFENILNLKEWKRDIEKGSHIDNIVGLNDVKIEWIKLKTDDDFIIELLKYHSHPSNDVINVPQVGSAHIALTISGIDAIYNKAVEAGYRCSCKPQISLDKKVKAFYCYGPSGVTLELVEELK